VKTYFDTATLYYRAFFAAPESITAPDGSQSGAIRGFLDMTASLLRSFPASEVVFAWDEDWRPAWRVALLPSYKAHRLDEASVDGEAVEQVPDALAPQVTAIADILDAIGLPRVGHVGHEADDVLGALVVQRGGPARVVTGDRDLFQLVDDDADISVVSITKGVRKLEVVTDAWLMARYGVTGRQYADFAAFRGDPSDGLPGVRGVGEKTASALIGRYGSMTGVLDAVAAEDPALTASVRTRIAAALGYLECAQQVVRVRTDAPLPKSITVPEQVVDSVALTAITAEWGVAKQVDRLLAAIR
jgi:5'-3' exonuclease